MAQPQGLNDKQLWQLGADIVRLGTRLGVNENVRATAYGFYQLASQTTGTVHSSEILAGAAAALFEACRAEGEHRSLHVHVCLALFCYQALSLSLRCIVQVAQPAIMPQL